MKKLIAIGCIGLALILGVSGTASSAGEQPRVRLSTNMGDITIELYPDKAPKTVANFADYVEAGFYNGTVFHRVIDGFMIQGGGFDRALQQKQTNAAIPNEADNGLQNKRGSVAMARTPDPQSASSQFFINLVDNDFLNYQAPTPRGWGYAVFGQVVEGMEVVDQIRKLPTGPAGPFSENVPREPVVIRSATIE